MFCRHCLNLEVHVFCFVKLPVTVSIAERSFSKLKLIVLRSSIAQDRLDSLALISIENKAAR